MIKQLNQESVTQISTSATLQSLSSFIKELVENSIDGESSQITIVFFNQGKNGFEVLDNGNGISEENQKLLATRGGTSKIQNFEDLQSVITHGFRGEALNAIAALSNMTICSKHKDDTIGWKWEVPNQITKMAKEKGTSVRVENIFHSLPVRGLEFQKNFKTEYNRAVNLLTEYAIINTHIEIRVYNEQDKFKKQVIFDSGSISQTQIQRISNILGEQTAQDLIEFESIQEGFTLKGFLSRSIESGSYKGTTRKTQWYCYINKKPINAPKLLLAIMRDIYRQHNPNGSFFFIVEIIMKDISDVDFNVSVDKRDVYIKNEKFIIDCLKQAVTETLEKYKGQIKLIGKDGTLDQFIVATKQETQKPSKTKSKLSEPPEKRKESVLGVETKQIEKRNSTFLNGLKSLNPQSKQQNNSIQEEVYEHQQIKQQQIKQEIKREQTQKTFDEEILSENDELLQEPNHLKQCHFIKDYFDEISVIGQFNKGFIIGELNGNIYVLDQHACDEKFNYERLLKGLILSRTQLLQPITINLPGFQVDLVQENIQQLNDKFKYQIEIVSNTIKLRTCPSYNNRTFGEEPFLKILHWIGEGKSIDEIEMPGIKNIVASQACRGSIMIGTELQVKEMSEVVKKLTKMQSPWNCPHGRPTLVQVEQPKQIQFTQGFSEMLLN